MKAVAAVMSQGDCLLRLRDGVRLRLTLPCYVLKPPEKKEDNDKTEEEIAKEIEEELAREADALREKIAIGVVGGSDLVKQKEQLGDSPNMFDWCFAENGLWAAKDGAVIGQTSFVGHLGEEKLKKLINWILKYFAELDIPVKRGTFIEFRNGMLNVSPIGCVTRHRLSTQGLLPPPMASEGAAGGAEATPALASRRAALVRGGGARARRTAARASPRWTHAQPPTRPPRRLQARRHARRARAHAHHRTARASGP